MPLPHKGYALLRDVVLSFPVRIDCIPGGRHRMLLAVRFYNFKKMNRKCAILIFRNFSHCRKETGIDEIINPCPLAEFVRLKRTVFYRPGTSLNSGAVSIDTYRLHPITPCQNIILCAAGHCFLIPLHGHHGSVKIKPELHAPEAVRTVSTVLIINPVDFQRIFCVYRGRQIQIITALIKRRIAGSEIAVQCKPVVRSPRNVEPVFRHTACQTIQISVPIAVLKLKQ